MREKDLHNLIEQQNPEVKQEIWERISSQIDMSELQPKKAVAAKPKRWKWAVVALALICVVTLAIVLPLTLKSDDSVRFCDVTQYTTEELQQTLKEYFLSHNKEILFVDWYDASDRLMGEYGYNKDDTTDIIYFREVLFNIETGETITLSITDNKTRVDLFELFDNINEQYVVKGVSVNWQSFNHTNFLAKFEYKGYIYYLQLDDSSQDRLTEIITDMIK